MANILSQVWLISRRHVLRGLGVSLALPLLDCMRPLLAADKAVRPKRSVFSYLPNGVNTHFQLDHIAAPEVGPALTSIGKTMLGGVVAVEPPPVTPVAYAVVEGTPKNAPWQLRGDREKPSEEVPRRWLSVFGGDAVSASSGSGRRQLAD